MVIRRAGWAAAAALHAAALAALLSYEPARRALASAVIMVDFVSPPRAEPAPQPVAEPPKPKPVARRAPVRPAPTRIVSAPVEARAPETPPPPAVPDRPEAPEAVAVEPKAPAIAPPVFNADYLENPPPRYPAISRRLGEEGRVVLRVLVSAEGRAQDVALAVPSGFARLDAAARDTVRRWRFVPAKRGEQPVAAWVLVPISFKLEG